MYRKCFKDSSWDTYIDFTECYTVEFLTLMEQANDAFGALTIKPTDTIVRFNMTEIDSIATDLSHLTGSSEIALPNDIDFAVDTIDIIFNVLG